MCEKAEDHNSRKGEKKEVRIGLKLLSCVCIQNQSFQHSKKTASPGIRYIDTNQYIS